MNDSPAQIASAIGQKCQDEGFVLWGASLLAPTQWEDELRAWILAGKHSEMQWLADLVDARLDPNRVLPGARSVVMVADLYATRQDGSDTTGVLDGKIARYARGRDYHKGIKKRLLRVCDRVRTEFSHAQTRVFCDTAPVLERELASLCGLGWIGKHTLLINPKLGSWMLLGGFFTTLELAVPQAQRVSTDHCGSCTRCIDACPTDAITPYSVDARACISYLTIEHRSEISSGLGAKLNGWVFGCDICQEVCPHNSSRSGSGGAGDVHVREEYATRHAGFDLLEVLGWNEQTRRERFTTSALKRVKLAQLKRNAVLVLGGLLEEISTDEKGCDEVQGCDAAQQQLILKKLKEVACDADEESLVRRTAQQVLRRVQARDC